MLRPNVWHPCVTVGHNTACKYDDLHNTKELGWCCERGLNSRPHPYQGCALPLSYHSIRAGELAAFDIWCKPSLDGFCVAW